MRFAMIMFALMGLTTCGACAFLAAGSAAYSDDGLPAEFHEGWLRVGCRENPQAKGNTQCLYVRGATEPGSLCVKEVELPAGRDVDDTEAWIVRLSVCGVKLVPPGIGGNRSGPAL